MKLKKCLTILNMGDAKIILVHIVGLPTKLKRYPYVY